MMRTPRTVYFVMAVWLLIGSAMRCVWLISHGFAIDYLPVISIVLGLGALVLAFRAARTTAPQPSGRPHSGR